jgi:hypothetical protein
MRLGGGRMLGSLASRRVRRLRGLLFAALFLAWGRLSVFLLGGGANGQAE